MLRKSNLLRFCVFEVDFHIFLWGEEDSDVSKNVGFVTLGHMTVRFDPTSYCRFVCRRHSWQQESETIYRGQLRGGCTDQPISALVILHFF
jgi:hypothetical protein